MGELLLAAAGLGIGYVAWRHHLTALVLIAALLPTYLLRFALLGVSTNFLEVSIGITALVGLLTPAVRHSWLKHVADIPKPVAWLTGLFMLAAIVSTITSPHLATSLGILKGWIAIPIIYGAMVYVAVRAAPSARMRIFQALIVSGAVVGLLGIAQLGQVDRINSIFDVPNSLALFLVPLIVVAVSFSRFERNQYSLAAVVMVAALLGTQSVAGALAVIATVALLARRRRLRLTPLQLGVGIAVLLVAAVAIAPKVAYLVQPSSSAFVRLQLWDVSLQLVREHPLRGTGLGTFEPAYQQVLHDRFRQADEAIAANAASEATRPLAEYVFRDPHNWILSFWLNMGLLGLASFAGLHIWIFRKQPWSAPHYALLALLLFGLVDTVFWKNDLATLHVALLALAIGAGTDPGLGSSPD